MFPPGKTVTFHPPKRLIMHPALHPTSSTCRNHKVWLLTPSWGVPWYRADFHKRHGQMCPLTQWAGWLFASHIFSRYHSDLLRINRLNLTLLCSDCPINHNGRLKFPEVKNNQKRFLDNNILIFLFFFFLQTTCKYHLSSWKSNQLWEIWGSSKVSFSLIQKPRMNSHLYCSIGFYLVFLQPHMLNCSQVDVRNFTIANNYTKEQCLFFSQFLSCALLHEC